MEQTKHPVTFVKDLGVDLVGVADLSRLQGIGLSGDAASFLDRYRYGIVMGA